jgi:hypothetical protein
MNKLMKVSVVVFSATIIVFSFSSVLAGHLSSGSTDTGTASPTFLPISSFLPDAPPGYDNIDSVLVSTLNPGEKIRVCFPLPKGWVNTLIRFWHPTNLAWVDLDTDTEIIGGVKHRCADLDANGTFAFQGQYVEGLVDPDKVPDPPPPPTNPPSDDEDSPQ